MTFTIRPMQTPGDFVRMAELSNTHRTDPVTPELVAQRNREFPAGGVQRHWVAVDETGYVLGWTFVRRMPHNKAGCLVTRTLVDPRFRRQGVGSALLRTAGEAARQLGASYLESDVRDNDPDSLAWARRHGFATIDHVFESTLDPAAFDEAPFAGLLERLEREGIRLCRLSDLPGEENVRKLYELEKVAAPDNPMYDWDEFVPFDLWLQNGPAKPTMPPEQYFVALDGDRFAGMTCLEVNQETGVLYSDFSCVHPAYRNRGIALALKILSVRFARAQGAPYMRTNNDSRNGPMLAVNRKLGYTPVPGFCGVRKELT